jgi:hypothetical protein
MRGKCSVAAVLAVATLGYPLYSTSAQERTLFQFVSEASNRCIRVEPPPAGAIIAGFLRTFNCGTSPDMLVDLGNNFPAQLKFTLEGGEERCIKVRQIDVETLPSDIFVHSCTFPISGWNVVGGTTGEVDLFNPGGRPLCMTEDVTRRTVTIDICKGEANQKWKIEPVKVRFRMPGRQWERCSSGGNGRVPVCAVPRAVPI